MNEIPVYGIKGVPEGKAVYFPADMSQEEILATVEQLEEGVDIPEPPSGGDLYDEASARVGRGVTKGLGSALLGAGQFAAKYGAPIGFPEEAQQDLVQGLQQLADRYRNEPTGGFEKAGKVIGELISGAALTPLSPGSASTQLSRAAGPVLEPAIRKILQVGTEGALSGITTPTATGESLAQHVAGGTIGAAIPRGIGEGYGALKRFFGPTLATITRNTGAAEDIAAQALRRSATRDLPPVTPPPAPPTATGAFGEDIPIPKSAQELEAERIKYGIGQALPVNPVTPSPGALPTLAEQTGALSLQNLEKSLAQRDPGFADLLQRQQIASNEARVNALNKLADTPERIAQLIEARRALPSLEAFKSAGYPLPVNVKPIQEALRRQLRGDPAAGIAPGEPRTAIRTALESVRDSLNRAIPEQPPIPVAPEPSPIIGAPPPVAPPRPDPIPPTVAGLDAVRGQISDLLEGRAGSDLTAARYASKVLTPIKELVEQQIDTAYPGFKPFLADYRQVSGEINQLQVLQDIAQRATQGIPQTGGAPALNPEVLRAAVADPDLVGRVTGLQRDETLASLLTPERFGEFGRLSDEATRAAQTARAAGHEPFPSGAPQELQAVLRGALGLPFFRYLPAINQAFERQQSAVEQELGRLLLDPQAGIKALQGVPTPTVAPSRESEILNALLPNISARIGARDAR